MKLQIKGISNVTLLLTLLMFVAACSDSFSNEDLVEKPRFNSKQIEFSFESYDQESKNIIKERVDKVFDSEFLSKLNNKKLIDVKTLGVVGDGVTNNTSKLQEILNSVVVNGGGAIFIPAGVYLTNPLTVYSNTVIYGEGAASVIKLLPQNLEPAEHWAILRMKGTPDNKIRNVHIKNLFIDGNKDKHVGKPGSFHETVTFDWGENSSITNLTIVDTIHNGIQVDGARNILIANNTIINADGWGIHLSDNGEGFERRTEDTLVVNNVVMNSGFRTNRGGIDQNPSSANNIFINNLAKDNSINYEIHNNTRAYKNNISIN